MCKIIGYRHTGIITKNIEKSKKFYIDLLGFEIIQDFWDNSDYINYIIGLKNANIRMIKMKEPISGFVLEILDYNKSKIYKNTSIHIALQVDDIDKMYNYLILNDVKFISQPILSSEGIAKVCFCFDPDGNRIELVELI